MTQVETRSGDQDSAPTAGAPRTPGGTVRKLILALAMALAAVGLCEAMLRALDYSYSPLHINASANRNDQRDHHVFEDRHFCADPELIWRPRNNYRPFNAQGFRGMLLPRTKGPEEYRIFALGDSNTLGWDDPEDEPGAVDDSKTLGRDARHDKPAVVGANWPRFLGQLLPAGKRKYTVVNAGVWGYTSFQGRGRFQQLLPFRPDMVLISFGGNDAHRVAVSDLEYMRMRPMPLLLRTRLGQLFWAARDGLTVDRPAWDDKSLVFRVSPEQYRDNLNAMLDVAAEHHFQCALLTRPYRGVSSDPGQWITHAPTYAAITREVGRARQVLVIDVYAMFKDRREYFADESHFTESGHRLVAQRIYEQLQSLLPH